MTAARATAVGVVVAAAGITEWNSAHAAENPDNAAALISRWNRSSYAERASRRSVRPDAVRPARLTYSPSSLSEANKPTASLPSPSPNAGMQ